MCSSSDSRLLVLAGIPSFDIKCLIQLVCVYLFRVQLAPGDNVHKLLCPFYIAVKQSF